MLCVAFSHALQHGTRTNGHSLRPFPALPRRTLGGWCCTSTIAVALVLTAENSCRCGSRRIDQGRIGDNSARRHGRNGIGSSGGRLCRPASRTNRLARYVVGAAAVSESDAVIARFQQEETHFNDNLEYALNIDIKARTAENCRRQGGAHGVWFSSVFDPDQLVAVPTGDGAPSSTELLTRSNPGAAPKLSSSITT